MKKLLSIALAIILLLTTLISCNSTGSSKGTASHVHDTADGKCSICGLDYFDELFKLVKNSNFYSENTKKENPETYGISCNNDKSNKYEYIINIENDNVLRLCCYRFVPGLLGYDTVPYQTLIVYITRSSIKKQTYDYRATEQDTSSIWKRVEIEGEIEATDFSASRVLDYEEYDGGSKSAAKGVAVYGSKLLKNAITEMLIPLLEENGLNISNYGFELFG